MNWWLIIGLIAAAIGGCLLVWWYSLREQRPKPQPRSVPSGGPHDVRWDDGPPPRHRRATSEDRIPGLDHDFLAQSSIADICKPPLGVKPQPKGEPLPFGAYVHGLARGEPQPLMERYHIARGALLDSQIEANKRSGEPKRDKHGRFAKKKGK